MKQMLIWMLTLTLLLTGFALAEVPAQMRVVNCDEWVSLRAEADSDAYRFAEVPLGTTVRGFYASNGDFSQCEYQGTVGYILNRFLEVVSGEPSAALTQEGEATEELSFSGGMVRAWTAQTEYCEKMLLVGYDEAGQELWTYNMESLGITELESLCIFINESAAQTMVMAYNSYYGLTALSASTGEVLWTLPCAEVSLGGSIRTAVSEDGTMYIGGYYGPDPAAISPEGKMLYRCSSLHEDPQQGETTFYWMEQIDVLSDGIAVHYENGDIPVKAVFDGNGNMNSWEEK